MIRLKREKITVAPKSCEILQSFVWWEHKLAPTIQTSVKYREFEKLVFLSFQQINFKRDNSTNLKAIFAAELADFPKLVRVKSWKKETVERSICNVCLTSIISQTTQHFNNRPTKVGNSLISILGHVHTNPNIFETAYFLLGFVKTRP